MNARDRLNMDLAAILFVLDEEDYVPEVSIYMALNWDIDYFTNIKEILLAADLATSTFGALTITPKGKDIAAQVRKFSKKD